jgi:phospholipid/cholesterol/gamma-HCH transport system permease protein
LLALLTRTGHGVFLMLENFGGLLSFLGITVVTGVRTLAQPSRLRFTALAVQMERGGLDALPIVGLLSFLIGIVLAYQGADQLRRFGAEIFVVNLVGISTLREMGILLAAIIVAGRSGSAYTAQIGTMQVNEEIDAMRAMGLDPIEVLVLPRVVALVIVMPLITVYADLMGIAGGAIMSWAALDLSFVQFAERLRNAVPMWAFWVGIIKAPVFGALIALTGCREGLKVSGSAESVGLQTTQSVVISIFLVILADAVFSIFFSLVGV